MSDTPEPAVAVRFDPAVAVLFDMDGLLVDSEPLWTIAEQELAVSLGGTWSAEIKAAVVGTRLDVAVPLVLRHFGVEVTPAAVADASDFLLRRMVELYAGSLPLMPGALELLDGLAAAGVRIALVSSSFRVLVDAATAGIGPERFELTIAGDEVSAAKPDPEPYLSAARLLGVDPADAIVLEDSPSGVTAGEAAGCIVVAVPSVTAIEATPARPVVASLLDVDPGWLVSLPAARRSAQVS